MWKKRRQLGLVLCLLGCFGLAPRSMAQGGGLPGPHHYQLFEGSSILDDCPVCARPSIQQPLRGGFTLELIEENSLFATYAVRDLSFSTGLGSSPFHLIEGSGTYRIGGEVALQHFMELDLAINGKKVHMTNDLPWLGRPWPMIGISLTQTQASLVQVFHLTLAAAPVRELWFSTANGFTPSDMNRPRGTPGDFLSSSGRVVRSAHELLQKLGLMPPVPPLGIDAFDVAPGGEVLFSLNEGAFSETLGALQHGDVLSERGRRLYLNQQLLEPFGLIFNALDLGLDALSIQPDSEVLFSITTDMASPKAGILHRGDLLSSRGVKVRSYTQLLSRFHPADSKDYGLDAVYAWSSGEIWFSTEDGFQDRDLGPIQHGDLLSDQGYRIVGNLDLLQPFQPIEDLADFGLDGLFVVTDYVEPSRAPVLKLPVLSSNRDRITLSWSGGGRVFQLEKEPTVTGGWRAASPVIPALEFEDVARQNSQPEAYYRVRQW